MGKTFIIAEAGVNHNGNVELAKKLVDEATLAGCDCVKFQSFKAELLASKKAQKAAYQNETTDAQESQLDMLKKLELSKEETMLLQSYCKEKGIMFLSTPFEEESLALLVSLGIKLIKIPSGEITNLPFLRAINKTELPVILSTGMSTLAEIADALKVLCNCNVSLLHCTTEYPCPFDAVNLTAMQTMRDAFGLPVGYSDHTQGIEIPIAAVAMGATIIEKHFTLDKNMEGPDHKASLEPHELSAMVTAIRNIEQAFGDGIKQASYAEQGNIAVARRSIVSKTAIAKGDVFTEANLTCKRPGNGMSPMLWDDVLGKVATKDYAEDDVLCEK